MDVINGLRARVGQDVSAFINPTTIGTFAAIIAWNAILPINSWLLLVAGIIGAEADITTRFNEVKDLWNNPSNLNVTQTSGWKTGYTIGTLFTAIPGILPANLTNEVKVAEEAAKLDSFSNIQDLILSEQRTINSISGLEPTGARQTKLNNFVILLKDIPSKVSDYELSGLSLLDKTIGELKPLGKKGKVLELLTKDTADVGNTKILKNILIDEVQAEAVTTANKPLASDLASAIIQSVDSTEYKPISTYFNGKGYENISKVIPRSSIPQYQSRFVRPEDLKNYNLPDTDEFKFLNPEQIIDKINTGIITKENLIGSISSSSMVNFFTTTEPIKNLTASQINSSSGLGLGIPNTDFNGLVEIQIDITKLPLENNFRLPVSVLGNQYFRPIKLSSNSGTTIGNYSEWITNEFSADSANGIITDIRGLSK